MTCCIYEGVQHFKQCTPEQHYEACTTKDSITRTVAHAGKPIRASRRNEGLGIHIECTFLCSAEVYT